MSDTQSYIFRLFDPEVPSSDKTAIETLFTNSCFVLPEEGPSGQNVAKSKMNYFFAFEDSSDYFLINMYT